MNGLMKTLLFAGLLVVALARTASASTAEIELVSGASTMTIAGSSVSGISFAGWNLSVTGVSESPSGSPVGIDLTSLVTPSGPSAPANTLEILFSDINFGVPATAFNQSYSAVVTGTGTTSQIAWASSGNTLFQKGAANLIGPGGAGIGGFTAPGGFATATGGPTESSSGYSLTLEQTFATTSGSGLFSVDGDAMPSPTPETSSIILFGTGLLGLIGAFVQRKRLGLSS